MVKISRRFAVLGGVVAVMLLGMQLVGPTVVRPPVDPSMRLEAQAPVPSHVQTILRRSCYDCHSSETSWPWYSKVAPVSWLVIDDVNRARGAMDFSRWGTYNKLDRADMLDEACEEVREGKMPLPVYLLMHRHAKLSSADVEALCGWTAAEAARLEGAGE